MNKFYLYAEYAYLLTACVSILVLAFTSSQGSKERHPIWATTLSIVCAIICHGMSRIYITKSVHSWVSLVFMGISILCLAINLFNFGGKAGYKNIIAFILSVMAAILLWSLA